MEQTSPPNKEIFFNGKNVIITGGSSGIGEALARQLSSLHANVTIIDISEKIEFPTHVQQIKADVADKSSLRLHQLSKIDTLIIAAGVTSETNDPSDEEKEMMEAVNIDGVRNTLEVFEKHLAENAQIVYIGTHNPPKEFYAQTKRQGAEIVREFSQTHPAFTVKIILSGPVRTSLFLKGKPPEVVKRIEENVGLYEPAEFANELVDKLVATGEKSGLEEETMYKDKENNL